MNFPHKIQCFFPPQKHLSEQDFESVFQMSRDSFDELPKWRRTSMKKEAGLF